MRFISKRRLAAAVTAVLLSSCGNVSREDVFIPYAVGSTPSEREAELIGLDSNANSIRDDMEAQIRSEFAPDRGQHTAIALAKVVTLALVQGNRGQPPSPAQKQHFVNVRHCLNQEANDHRAADAVQALVLNTPLRKNTFDHWLMLARPLPSPSASCGS